MVERKSVEIKRYLDSKHKFSQSSNGRFESLEHAVANLTDAELIALYLSGDVESQQVARNAEALLEEFSSLQHLMRTLPDRSHCCADPRGYLRLTGVLEIYKRMQREKLTTRDSFEGPEQVKRYLAIQLENAEQEIFAIMLLDNSHRLIRFEKLFYGTVNGAQVYPRVILQRVLKNNAAALILAHNHPSGVAEPSHADKQITNTINELVSLVDVRLLDHLVVGAGEVVSFAERGLI